MAESIVRMLLESDDTSSSSSDHSSLLFDNITSSSSSSPTHAPTLSPTEINITETFKEAEAAEEAHVFDANASLLLNVTIIGCILIAYAVKHFRIYYLPESAGALIVGMFLGGFVTLTTDNLQLFEFSPEVFFFFLLPPIIFEAGYSLDRKGFFDNIGAITLFAMGGTIISTFVVGILCFGLAKSGLIRDIDHENPMEALIFGALISAVDPVATLSIMGNSELNCDPLLYSLVFGESVLNDAIAIALFKTFFKYYDPEGPEWSESEIPSALLAFFKISILSIFVGVGLGLAASWLYKHTQLSKYPKLETALLFCFCYLCYGAAEAISLSGIMALFFQGVVLSHYNSYNLSTTAHVASEHIFSTFATITETIVFLYMGMGVFTGRFQNWDISFSIWALVFCFIGRFLNIFPLSWLANRCRKGRSKIPLKMQCVLWFAGLRGAIAFALSENMPGPHKEVYATATLSICIFTTIVCGGFTECMLRIFEMKEEPMPIMNNLDGDDDDDVNWTMNRLTFTPKPDEPPHHRRGSVYIARQRMREGIKGMWRRFDDEVLKPHFGGSTEESSHHHHHNHQQHNGRNGVDSDNNSDDGSGDDLGNFELGSRHGSAYDESEEHVQLVR